MLKVPVLIHSVKQNIVPSGLNTLNIKLLAIPRKLEMTVLELLSYHLQISHSYEEVLDFCWQCN